MKLILENWRNFEINFAINRPINNNNNAPIKGASFSATTMVLGDINYLKVL